MRNRNRKRPVISRARSSHNHRRPLLGPSHGTHRRDLRDRENCADGFAALVISDDLDFSENKNTPLLLSARSLRMQNVPRSRNCWKLHFNLWAGPPLAVVLVTLAPPPPRPHHPALQSSRGEKTLLLYFANICQICWCWYLQQNTFKTSSFPQFNF